MRATKIVLATSNGDVDGSEVMLQALAKQARELGVPFSVVGPAAPSTLIEASRAAGHPPTVLPVSSRAVADSIRRAADGGSRTIAEKYACLAARPEALLERWGVTTHTSLTGGTP